jgi:hypothetical protein
MCFYNIYIFQFHFTHYIIVFTVVALLFYENFYQLLSTLSTVIKEYIKPFVNSNS